MVGYGSVCACNDIRCELFVFHDDARTQSNVNLQQFPVFRERKNQPSNKCDSWHKHGLCDKWRRNLLLPFHRRSPPKQRHGCNCSFLVLRCTKVGHLCPCQHYHAQPFAGDVLVHGYVSEVHTRGQSLLWRLLGQALYARDAWLDHFSNGGIVPRSLYPCQLALEPHYYCHLI